jgi:hypothetical protein
MLEGFDEEKTPVKKKHGCLTAVIIAILLALGFMLYAMIDFRNMVKKDWKHFNNDRITKVEKYLDMTIPDGVTPLRFKWESAPGDGSSLCRLIVEGISEPEDFLSEAFPDVKIKECTTDDEQFSHIKNTLDDDSGYMEYSVEFTEIFERVYADNPNDEYYIGFGKTDNGYCAVIRYFNSEI